MHEILGSLPADSYVLDLGCAKGSFRQEATRAKCVRFDRDPPPHQHTGALIVQGDAAMLPFRPAVFAAIVSNHSLEHFNNLDGALSEIARVISPQVGRLYIAVPDASTITDRLYRWLGRGGGHVNAFTSAGHLARMVERSTGLPHVATRTLCSSLSFLNRRIAVRPLPRRMILIGGGHEWSLIGFEWLSRRLDRFFRRRTSVYGWALYFGAISEPVNTRTSVNVCILCGSGTPSAELATRSLVASSWGFDVYRCPDCGTTNSYIDDFEIAS
jgi:SAM-dependent methyltransferase